MEYLFKPYSMGFIIYKEVDNKLANPQEKEAAIDMLRWLKNSRASVLQIRRLTVEEMGSSGAQEKT